jgi:Icc-related predicted phosphoesterase
MVRIVCISDIHGSHREINLPKGDMLIIAGDIGLEDVHNRLPLWEFNRWLGEQDFKHIICAAGNHDWFCEKHPEETRAALTNCHYLAHESIEIEGFKIFGSPISAWFYDWAFNVHRGPAIAAKWAQIPTDTNILVTHGPPYGVLDVTPRMQTVGDEDLERRIALLPNLKLMVFGHIHFSYGQLDHGGVKYINASSCTEDYLPDNPPIVVDI